MKIWAKRFFCVVLTFAFCFFSIGYAQFSDILSVTGDADYKFVYEGIMITSAVTNATNGLTEGSRQVVFPTSLKNSISLTANGASITYKLTIRNTSSRYKYTYKGIQCDESFNNDLYSTKANNDKFTVSLTKENGSTFAAGSSLEPNEEIVLYATYTFGNNITKQQELTFMLNYQFGVHVDSMGEMAVEKTMTAFIGSLNEPEKYENLIVNIDNKYSNADWQANYIGNVSQAGENNASDTAKADAAIVENLIGSGLTLNIDGVEKKVTVLIKRENIDGNENTGDAYIATNGRNSTSGTGCEMTIYMTPNNLDKIDDPGEYDNSNNDPWDPYTWAEVFISISTCTNNGTIDRNVNSENYGNYTIRGPWYSIGDIYEGIANIVTYDGAEGPGSFVTDNWKSISKTYKVTENYSYTIAAGQNIETIVQATDTNAINEFTRLLQLAQDEIAYIDANSDYFKIAEYAQPIATLREVTAQAEAMSVNRWTTRVTLIPILKSLENATYPFQNFLAQNTN